MPTATALFAVASPWPRAGLTRPSLTAKRPRPAKEDQYDEGQNRGDKKTHHQNAPKAQSAIATDVADKYRSDKVQDKKLDHLNAVPSA